MPAPTITSEAILYAVNNALDPETYPSTAENGEEEEKEPQQIAASALAAMTLKPRFTASTRSMPMRCLMPRDAFSP